MKTPVSRIFSRLPGKPFRSGAHFISPSANAGFTLIEISIVVAVLGILAMIAVPQVTGLIGGYRLNGAARLVLGDLQNARMTAIQQNRPIQVTFSATGYSFAQADTNVTIFSRNLTQDYPGTTLSNSGGTMTLAPTGMTAGSTVTLTGGAATRTITVSTTGRMLLN